VSDFLELTLHNRASEIPLAHQALDEFAAKHGLPAAGLAKLHVAIEEHLINVISYGYTAGQKGTIRAQFALVPSGIRVQFEDDADPFNPLELPKVDTSVPLDRKPIGGLGVHMLRNAVDELTYTRAGDRNIVTMFTHLADPQRLS
jgi:anti-sigma regulatory factor (Ser/Thr protein kinase)